MVWIGWNRRYVKIEGSGRPPIKGVTCNLRCPFSSSDMLFQSKLYENLVWIGWNRRCAFSGGQKPLISGGYMWPAMPIFELDRAIPVKSHVWKFGSDWLSFSRVIVSTNIQKKKKHYKHNWKQYTSFFRTYKNQMRLKTICILFRSHHNDQIHGIMKNNWLSVIEREEVERQLTPNEMREDQEQPIDSPNSQDEDSHNNTTPAARS